MIVAVSDLRCYYINWSKVAVQANNLFVLTRKIFFVKYFPAKQ